MSLWSTNFQRPMTKGVRSWILLLLVVFSVQTVFGQSRALELMNKMSLEEKIAQLMIVRVSSTGSASENKSMIADIKRYQPGGVCFFKGGPVREANLTNQMQAVSKVPLFVSIDGEWGPAMRLDSCTSFPRQMTLGALPQASDSLIYAMGLEIASQCKAIGVNLNYAPCIDINNNPKNPVINSRSFGENREKVTRKAALYLKGMQDGGIIGCIKHFPGHGDTETDSHTGLPVIKKSRIDLDELELYPYRQFIHDNVEMIMVGHLNIPALDSHSGSVSSLSFPIVSYLLQRDYGYDGLIITDGMEMSGVRNQNKFEGDVEIKALLAGVDLLLLPGETDAVIKSIKTAVNKGTLPIELINERCLRVLSFKEQKGLLDYHPVDLRKVPQAIASPNAIRLRDSLEYNALTLLKNDDNILPLRPTKGSVAKKDSIAFLCVGRSEYNKVFQKLADQYGMRLFYQDKSFPTKTQAKSKQQLLDTIAPYGSVVVVYGGSNQVASKKYDVDVAMVDVLNRLAARQNVVLLHIGNPYALDLFGSLNNYKAVMVAYQPTATSINAAVEASFGDYPCRGSLPVSIDEYPSGTGITSDTTTTNISLLSPSDTKTLDELLQKGIQDEVYPGCVVLVAKDGQVIYHKAFGYYTYDHQHPVSTNTLYDIASITKTAATTLAVMRLYDEGKIQLEDHIGQYLPYLKGTNKANITLAELLTHTSGMPAFIPFYTKIQNDERYLRHYKTPHFSIKVADNLYLRNDYPDTMRYKIAHCSLGQHQYVYSDLNMLLLKDMVEKVTGMAMDSFLTEQFYAPMGLKRTCFTPLDHGFTKVDIAPTERDETFRNQVVQGYVHDQTAALFYGNAGDAGLFTTAEELAAIYQMLLDSGAYKGKRYLSEQTVRLFTSAYELHGCKIRGLGFHTPKHAGTSSIVPADAGIRTFGHQGFTGTVVWCDPDTRLVYVFLSNRVYPTCYPNKLSQSRIRLLAHEIIYKAIK